MSRLLIWRRGVVPAKLQAGHYAAVYNNEMWVFPGPRNHNMRRVFCLDMQRSRCGGRQPLVEGMCTLGSALGAASKQQHSERALYGGPCKHIPIPYLVRFVLPLEESSRFRPCSHCPDPFLLGALS